VVRAAIIAPNGQPFTFASDDDPVKLIDLMTACLRGGTLEGFSIAVIVAATAQSILLDGQFLASTPDDLTVKLRDLSTASSCSTIQGHSASLITVVFPSDDRLLASASHDKSVRINNVKTNDTTQINQAEEAIRELSISHEYWLILMRRLMVLLFLASCVFGFWLSPLSR
jgi:WD40 repeat protein